jgi:hypothetical protein
MFIITLTVMITATTVITVTIRFTRVVAVSND